jgi:response regulator RpfG family c-di-GMP phosphodiesterase
MQLTVLVLEDEPSVREALTRDLGAFGDTIRIEVAEDVDDAWAAVAELDADGDRLALVLADHRLPGTSGVDFLVQLLDDTRTVHARKVLVTGQADHQDTIRAVNEAGLDHYIAKPWDPDELTDVVREQLTEHVLEHRLDPLPHLRALDAARVMPLLRDRGDR